MVVRATLPYLYPLPQSVTLQSAINQSGASGHWSNGTFYLMEQTTQYADSGYAYRTHYFPTNPGVDGVRAEPVIITLRKQGTQETLTVTITPQSTVGLPPNQILLDGGTTPHHELRLAGWSFRLPQCGTSG